MKKLIFVILLINIGLLSQGFGQDRRGGNNNAVQRVGRDNGAMYKGNMRSSFSPNASSNLRQQQPTTTLPKSSEWRHMSLEEKKDAVNKMSPQDRSTFLQQMKQNIVIEDLSIPQDKVGEFRDLYAEYQESQKRIKDKFIIDKNLDHLSDEEANKRLNQSFEVGQQLLNNRKMYAEKFLKILTPQQVLKLFQTEGKVREKILDKKNNSN